MINMSYPYSVQSSLLFLENESLWTIKQLHLDSLMMNLINPKLLLEMIFVFFWKRNISH